MRYHSTLILIIFFITVFFSNPLPAAALTAAEKREFSIALINAKNAFHKSWASQKNAILTNRKIQLNHVRSTYELNIRKNRDRDQRIALKRKLNADVDRIMGEYQVKLDTAYAGALDSYHYNVEQIYIQYGVPYPRK